VGTRILGKKLNRVVAAYARGNRYTERSERQKGTLKVRVGRRKQEGEAFQQRRGVKQSLKGDRGGEKPPLQGETVEREEKGKGGIGGRRGKPAAMLN